MLALPVTLHAQEATLTGTVTDTTGGALPGVTVRAVHEASGNGFEAVTDARGDYRLAVRIGAYRLTADMAGFAPVTRALTLLAGQEAVVNLEMAVSGVQETVTVTGEAPLLDLSQSKLGGNIDSRQQQELQVNGCNWVDLIVLAPGARVNEVKAAAERRRRLSAAHAATGIPVHVLTLSLAPRPARANSRVAVRGKRSVERAGRAWRPPRLQDGS